MWGCHHRCVQALWSCHHRSKQARKYQQGKFCAIALKSAPGACLHDSNWSVRFRTLAVFTALKWVTGCILRVFTVFFPAFFGSHGRSHYDQSESSAEAHFRLLRLHACCRQESASEMSTSRSPEASEASFKGSGRHCSVRGYTYNEKKLCELHKPTALKDCPCDPPYRFHFPKNAVQKREWLATLQLKSPLEELVCVFLSFY